MEIHILDKRDVAKVQNGEYWLHFFFWLDFFFFSVRVDFLVHRMQEVLKSPRVCILCQNSTKSMLCNWKIKHVLT